MMFFNYAVYFTMCWFTAGGEYRCIGPNYRQDYIETVKLANRLIQIDGEHPHWRTIDGKPGGEPIFSFAYGECYKGRQLNEEDMNVSICVAGGVCSGLVCRE